MLWHTHGDVFRLLRDLRRRTAGGSPSPWKGRLLRRLSVRRLTVWVTSVLTAAAVVLVLLNPGVATHEVDLHDGGVCNEEIGRASCRERV